MSTIVGNLIDTSSYTSAGSSSYAELTPQPADKPVEIETLAFTATSRRLSGQLTQARLDQPSARNRRETLPASVAGPAPADVEKADKHLQSALDTWLISGLLHRHLIPEHSSVKPFVDLFVEAAQKQPVQSWFKSKGLDLSTVRVYSDWVEGTVVIDGKHVTRKFTATDGSGWGEVGAKVTAAANQLNPYNYGGFTAE
ncbi:hypothetical protein LRS56_12205 [Pseudomonas poae]|nr:hypothetical protein LRS56_12205 [Pseudomonas poae]